MQLNFATRVLLALLVSFGLLFGMIESEHFQQAAAAESGGFDALAHDVFGTGSPAKSIAKARGSAA